ncbi:MAG: hypothetical protein F9K47_15565 [Burkholderiales bacterium]|nr:MAG: hypothetical protein F9K47_15565 [Burkholderiales bacterium]
MTVAFILMLLSLWPLYDHYGHPVRVYDGATGEPIEGALAVGRWGASGWISMVSSREVCYKLLVARSGTNGMLYMPRWSWSGRALSLSHDDPLFFPGGHFFLYRPGYYEGPREANPPGQRIMWRDPRTGMERLHFIEWNQSNAECNAILQVDSAIQLGPVFDAMLQEAKGLASTPNERIVLSNIRWARNYLLFGSEAATEMNRQERAKEEKK